MKLSFFQSLQNKLEPIIPQGMMVNWSAFDKGLFILLLCGLDQISWLIWCVYSYMTPDLRVWIRPDYMFQRIIEISLTLSLSFICLFGLYKLRNNQFFYKITPLFSVLLFAGLFLHAAYSIGISSPTTAAGFISIVSLGFLFVERKFIYIAIFPATVILLLLIHLSLKGKITYAPVFSDLLNSSDIYKNTYWISSMAFLYVPIFIVSTLIFETLLRQWRNREKEIKALSEKDGLTNVYNRRSIAEKLTELNQHELSYAVVLLDLDYFKTINDHYGHDTGDQVLRHVATILNHNLRQQDMVGRFGGEEFILILNEVNLSFALEIAERCRQQIEKTQIFNRDGFKIDVTASFGIALGSKDEGYENTVNLADKALYLAKSEGRNQVRHYLEKSTFFPQRITNVSNKVKSIRPFQ